MPHGQSKKLHYGRREFDLSTARTNERVEMHTQHLSIVQADAAATIRLGDPEAAPLPARKLESVTLPEPIDRIYISNSAASSGDKLILFSGIDGTTSTTMNPDTAVDVTDDSAREVGKVRVQDSGGVLIDPATQALEEALQSNGTDPFLVQEDTALDVSAATVPTEQQTPVGVENTGGTQVDPATEGSLTSTLSREIASWTAGTLAVEQQTPVALEDTTGTQIDPLAAGDQPLDVSGATVDVQEATALDVSAATVPVEQQTPVGLEDAAGTQVDPSQQETYGTEYTSVDISATGTTTVYSPTSDATVEGVYLASDGTSGYQLEVTDGTNTAVIADPGAGNDLAFEGELRLAGGTDSVQIVVETAGSGSETAAVARGEL